MDSPKHIAQKPEEALWKQQWQEKPLPHRLHYMAKLVVPHPQFFEAVSEVRRRTGRCIRQSKGAAMSVIAPTGAGKSTLAKYCQQMWPDRTLPELTLRRVVVFTIPPRPSSGSMSSAVLKALGDPRWEKGKAQILQERTKYLLTKCRTRLVLIDNVHDVPERRRRSGVREVGNWIRDLVDTVSALFVSLGAEQGLDVFNANSQVRRRSPAHMRIDYFGVAVKKDAAQFLRFLYELDKNLPLAKMSGLSEPKLAARIWMASHGVMDYIMQITTEALELAVKKGQEQLTLEDLAQGFKQVFKDATPATNPFDPKTPFRRLDREGEPFFQWLEDGYA